MDGSQQDVLWCLFLAATALVLLMIPTTPESEGDNNDDWY